MSETDAIPNQGTEALLRDVIAVPRDKDAKRLVEAILEQTRYQVSHQYERLAVRLSIIQGLAERLAVLLAQRDTAAVEALEAAKDALAWEINERDSDPGGDPAYRQVAALLARVKGAE